MSAQGKADQAFIRKHNAALVLNQLRLHAPLSRAELAKRIGLNRSTISSLVSQLLGEALIHETEFQTDKIGRPGLLLELNPLGGCAVGVEIGVDFVHVILSDFTGSILWRRRLTLETGEPQDMVLRIAEQFIRQAIADGQGRELKLLGLGVCVPGMVDVEAGALRFAPNLGWHDLPFRERWSQRFGVPIFVENDANAAALGEYYFGAARNVENFIYLGAMVGLGGGILVDGKLFRGRGGYAGEFGHMTIDPHGETCGCGKQGCWETLVGPRAVLKRYRQRRGLTAMAMDRVEAADITFADLVGGASAGDLVALAVLQDMAKYLGIGIANLVNVFNPQLVVLGGALSQAGEQLIPLIKETVKQNSLFPMRANLSIVPSLHNTDDSVLGAVALVIDDLMQLPE